MVNELLWLLLLLFNFLSIIVCYRIWGKSGLYVWIPIATIAANIQVTKTIELFGIEATLGNIVYATSFLATDILNENYDKKSASKAVGIGFFSLIVFTISMNLALLFIPSSSDFVHESMSNIFSILPRIVAASLIAYAVSQLHDVWSYDMWKRRKPSKRYIWLRNNASTLVSQLLDSIIFTTIAFWGVFSGNVLLEITITTYVLKVIVAAADTPFIYIAQKWKESGKIRS
ncbi:MAG: queuosine precursor transporter [Spirochaetia bacterium]|nr:queuosine precursor transporter [Spirochaetia bacterium]MCF7946318.1 queuosine precursor transporter [Spirochaetia bacterium]